MKKYLLSGLALLALLGMAGCEDHEGPAERAGESIDEATDEAGDAMEDAGDEIEDAVD